MCLKGKLLRVSQGFLNTLRYCSSNYIRGPQHNHLQGCGEQTSYANAFLCFITLHYARPQSVVAVKRPREIPAVNSEQITAAANQTCHLH